MSSMSTRLCTHGVPASCLSGTLESCIHMMGRSTLRIQLTIRASVDQGRGWDTGWLWTRYLEERGMGEKPHFLLTPSSTSAASAIVWAIIHTLAIGRLVRWDYIDCFHYFIFVVFIQLIMHVSIYACNYVNYLYISKFMFHCILNFYFIDFFCRMAQFHLLDPTYEAAHWGCLIAERQIIIYTFCSNFCERTCVREVTRDYVLFHTGPSAPSS